METVLVATVGLSPATVTETVWALAEECPSSVPSKILAVTTAAGRSHSCAALFSPGGGWPQLTAALSARGLRTPTFGPEPIHWRVPVAHSGGELEDLRHPDDTTAFGDLILEILRGFTARQDCRVICSLAGGRKTLSALLALNLSMVGRRCDELVHVLVDEAWEHLPGFWFPGCAADQSRGRGHGAPAITLHRVPFVPLGEVLGQDHALLTASYASAVARATAVIVGEARPRLVVDAVTGTFSINGQTRKPPALAFGLLWLLAQRAQAGAPPLLSYKGLEDQLGAAALAARPADNFGHWAHAVVEARQANKLNTAEDARKWRDQLVRAFIAAGLSPTAARRVLPRRGHLALGITPPNLTLSPSAADTATSR